MGIVNASPDSFSDGGLYTGLDTQVVLARELLAAGADILDVGGESASTGRPPVDAAAEIERVVPLVRSSPASSVRSCRSTPTSRRRPRRDRRRRADRQRRQRAARSGARRGVCADRRRAGDHAHARRPPGTAAGPRSLRRHRRRTCSRSCASAPRSRSPRRGARAADPRSRPRLRQDARADDPAAAQLERLHELGRPLLMAISRKDFIGALTGRRPRARGRDAGRACLRRRHGAHVFRLHDIAGAADFLAVRARCRRAPSRARISPGR